MARQDFPGLQFQNVRSGTWGTSQREIVVWKTSAFPAGDSIRLMKLHPSMEILSVGITVVDAAAAAATLSVGYEDAADHLTYFLNAEAINATKFVDSRDKTKHAPLKVTSAQKYLVGHVTGAAIADAVHIVFDVEFLYRGHV